MKLKSISDCIRKALTSIVAALTLSLASCGAVFEDLDPCDQGVRLRFLYDYNMLFANAFPSQVHCLTLLVYDNEGNYITTKTVTDRELLSDEDWRLDIDLPGGDYKLVAYGGMACPDASFSFEPLPGVSVPMTDVDVFMHPGLITTPKGTQLHDLFYGALDISVPAVSTGYTEGLVKMMKDTNNLRIVLQHLDYTPVKSDDFTFEVTANNTVFNYENKVISTSFSSFCPYVSGEEPVGVDVVGDDVIDVPAEVAYAEFSLSRLMVNGGARLEIRRAEDNGSVVSIPLDKYLLLLKSQRYVNMLPQEFLDRESEWCLFFFLDKKNRWVDTKLVINDWVVRINDIEA